MINEYLSALLLPAGGWILYVERRLAKLSAIEEKIDRLDERIEKLVDHLIGTVKKSD